jgi:predicted Zn-dependent protease with MMP-like domain
MHTDGHGFQNPLVKLRPSHLCLSVFICGSNMTRQRFEQLVVEALDALPRRFRERIRNVAVVVEGVPEGQRDPAALLAEDPTADLLMGEFVGVPTTEKSVWDTAGPDRVVLYQKNIEAICETDDEIREEVRLTVLHELGHYFGMNEEQLEDV